MEALEAVGLATNIITFVDFAVKLVKAAKEISSSGSLSDLDQIQSRTTHLQRLVQPLRVHPGLPISSTGRELGELARNCVGIAAEATTTLNKIYAHVQGPLWFKNGRVAFRALKKKERLESLQKRLDSYQSLILTQVALLIREDQMSIFTLATDIRKRNDESAARVRGQLDSLRGDLISAVDRGRTDTASGQASISCLLGDLKSKLEHLIQTDEDDHLVKTILDKLWFDGMLDRESAVHDPAGNSYGWLLDPQPDHESHESRELFRGGWRFASGLKWQAGHEETRIRFNHWLTAEAGLFYISGKPGSGKSTLMKFLVQNTRSRLEIWAAAHSRKLLVVSFFFWISGTPMQRSFEGLYRAVLWEILKVCPQLIPEVFPSRWKDPNTKDDRIHHLPLSDSEIRQALERLRKALDSSHALCLFIDGLDEYNGDHWKLGHELASWKSDHVKICVSARPYNAFDQTLPLDTSRHFRLQDLNQEDIMHYVQATLSEDQRFGELRAQDDYAAEETIRSLTGRSDGVFLWAVLATRTLLGGLGNMYSATQLLEFLDTDIPSDLEAMFLQILDRLPKADRRLAAISLLSMSRDISDTWISAPCYNVIFHWYIEESLGKSDHYALHPDQLSCLNLQQSTSDQIMAARSRFNSRCSSFIGWEDPGGYTFHIIHRTLHDFLLLPATRLRLQSMAETTDVRTITANACRNLLYDFSGPQKELTKSWPHFWNVFVNLVIIAERSRDTESEFFDKVALSVIEELPRACPDIRTRTDLILEPVYFIELTLRSRPHWFAESATVVYSDLVPVFWNIAFKGGWNFLLRTGRKLIQQVPEVSKPGILLTTAISALSAAKIHLPKALHVVQCVLEDVSPNSTVAGHAHFNMDIGTWFTMGTGSGPNEHLSKGPFSPTASVWELFLQAVFYILDQEHTYSLQAFQLIELFLSSGANSDCWFVGVETYDRDHSYKLPARLHCVSLRRMLALQKVPISDAIDRYLQKPEVEGVNDSAIACPEMDEVTFSSFLSLGVAEGQRLSSFGYAELYAYEFQGDLVFGSIEAVEEYASRVLPRSIYRDCKANLFMLFLFPEERHTQHSYERF